MQDLRATRPEPGRIARQTHVASRGPRGRVHWTAHERAQLVQSAARRLSSLQARSRLDALRQAQQEVLPPARRRRVAAVTGLTWFLDGLAAETARLQQQLDRASVDVPVASATPSSIAELVLLAAPLLRRAAVDLLGDAVEAALCRVLQSLPPRGLLARTRRSGTRAAR